MIVIAMISNILFSIVSINLFVVENNYNKIVYNHVLNLNIKLCITILM